MNGGNTEMSGVSELIRGRRSVRTFDGRAVSQDDRKMLERYISGISNPLLLSQYGEEGYC